MPSLDHIALEVLDLDTSIDFYTNKLGFSFVSRAIDEKGNEEYCYLESEGSSLELLLDQRINKTSKCKIQRPNCPHI